MSVRFISPALHGALDYAAAAALIVAPFILGLAAGNPEAGVDPNPIAHWVSVAAGAGLIVYSLLTDYALSAAKVLPFKLHLAFDFAAAIVFLIAPFVLGFSGVAFIYYLVMGGGVLMVVALSNTMVEAEA